eukprot:Colp12_sorted_trinity150504_noHs@36007
MQVGEQRGGEVALAEGGDDHDDVLSGVLRPAAHLDGGSDGCTGGDAHEDALLGGQGSGGGDGGVGVDLDDAVDEGGVAVLRDEAGADALDLVGTGRAAGQHRRLGGLHRNQLQIGVLGTKELRGSGGRAAGANTTDEDVNLALGLVPDLGAGGLSVGLGVVGVVELLKHEALAIQLVQNLLSLLDGARHALLARRENQLGTEGLQHDTSLKGESAGHDHNQLVTASSSHHRQSDASVATGRLHKSGHTRNNLASGFSRQNHALGDSILDGAARLHGLELQKNVGNDAGFLANSAQPHERSPMY